MNNILSINNLSKSYGKVQALNDLSLSVPEGSVYGILGPNGSGKTTTLAIILGILRPDHGDWSWFGQPPAADNLKRIGALLETPNFYPYLNAVDNLKIVADIRKVKHSAIDPVLESVGLLQRKKSPFSTYSLGMKQRLAVASAMLGDPDVLVLDEPTNGLDPQGIAEMRELILRIASEGKTILLASHLLAEVEKVCSHVAILQKGVLRYKGPAEIGLSDSDVIEVAAEDLQSLSKTLEQWQEIKSVKIVEKRVRAEAKGQLKGDEVNKYLYNQGIIASHLRVQKKNLEAQFLELLSENK